MKKFVLIFLILFACSLLIDSRSVSYDDEATFQDKIEKFSLKFTKDQADIIKTSETSIDELKTNRDNDLSFLKYRMSRIKLEISDRDEEISGAKQGILEKISKINNSTSVQFEALREAERMLENQVQLNKTKLSDRKHNLESFAASLPDDILEEMEVEQQIIEINEQLAMIDKDYLEKSEIITSKLKYLKDTTATALNDNYKKLIDVYENQEKKNEGFKTLNDLQDEAINEWQEYAENIDEIQSKLAIKLKNFAASNLKFDSIMTIDDQSALDDFSISYLNTKILLPKVETNDISNDFCSSFVIDDDNSLIVTDCAGTDESKIQLTFNHHSIECLRSENDLENFYSYDSCSFSGEFKYSYCETFVKTSIDGEIMGYQCIDDDLDQSINTNGHNYKCRKFSVLDDNVIRYSDCKKVFEDVNDYEVNTENTKFFIPKVKNIENEVKCEEFLSREDDNVYASNCQERFDELPKEINFKGVTYTCHNALFPEADSDYYIYLHCEKPETTTKITTTTTETSKFNLKIANFGMLLMERCKYYVIDGTRNYIPLDCQIKDLSKYYVYNGTYKSVCTDIQMELDYFTFTGCEVDDTIIMPTTADLNLDYYKVDIDTRFYIPLAASDYEEITQCNTFSYKNDYYNEIFASNCRESKYFDSKSVTFNGVDYDCETYDRSVTFDNYYYLRDCKPSLSVDYEWIEFHDSLSHLPQNVVNAGFDFDNSTLYVIRRVYADNILYGKAVNRMYRNQGYITNDEKEIGYHDYELLTAENYVWCKYDSFRSYKEMPICRVPYKYTLTPGTLLDNGACRIGYDWKIVEVTDDVETLIIGQNDCDE